MRYRQKFPCTISEIAIDWSDEAEEERILLLMAKAIKTNTPLTDDIFNIPPGASI